MAKDRFQQAMLIGIGIMVAIGFSGVFTYGPLVNSGDGSNQGLDDSQEINATIPESNFIQGSFNLSITEEGYLAARNGYVFVNVLYESVKTNYTQLEDVPSIFDNQVYVNSINVSESAFSTRLNVSPPSAVVVGDKPTRTRRGTLPYSIGQSQITEQAVISAVCDTKNDISQYGAVCYG